MGVLEIRKDLACLPERLSSAADIVLLSRVPPLQSCISDKWSLSLCWVVVWPGTVATCVGVLGCLAHFDNPWSWVTLSLMFAEQWHPPVDFQAQMKKLSLCNRICSLWAQEMPLWSVHALLSMAIAMLSRDLSS